MGCQPSSWTPPCFTLRAAGYGGSFFVACPTFHPQFNIVFGSRSAARARAIARSRWSAASSASALRAISSRGAARRITAVVQLGGSPEAENSPHNSALSLLANDGHDTRALQHYLGHKSIQHTVRYTEMAPDRFKDFWRD